MGLLHDGMSVGFFLRTTGGPNLRRRHKQGLENPCHLFADDIKLLVSANEETLHRYLDMVYQWSVRWDRH